MEEIPMTWDLNIRVLFHFKKNFPWFRDLMSIEEDMRGLWKMHHPSSSYSPLCFLEPLQQRLVFIPQSLQLI